MKRLISVALVGFAIGLPGARSAELKAGAGSVVITPPAGTPMAGYYFARAADGVHDDLHSKAIVIQTGNAKCALVALDLISTTRDLVADARAEIEKATGIPGSAVMISATHAHTGPVINNRGARESDLGGASDAARAYREALPSLIAESVRIANGKLAPAVCEVARGREGSIAFNRRFHMTDGTVGWNPGKLNPKIVKPAGTIDPEVPIVCFATADGKPIATYVNYAVHLDNVGGAQISADLPHTLSKLLADVHGPDMVTLFTAGCCGDINHIDVSWKAPQKGHENAARMGIILAAEVLKTWPDLNATNKTSMLRTRSEIVPLPLPTLPDDAEAKAKAVIARREAPKEQQPSFLEVVDAYKVLDVFARRGKPLEVEVQVIALGDEVAWVSLPGEIFVELGLEIKQDSPYRHTIIAELANGAIGYIPARRAYTQGNYEVISARCAQGSGEMLVDAAVRLLKALHAEATDGR